MESVVSVGHIRQHVMDDAADLISLLGLLDPLVGMASLRRNDDAACSGRLLRKLLSWDLILVVCRLHEPAGEGRTGVTASIDALLDKARADVGEQRADELKSKRQTIIANLETRGTKFDDLRKFRTAEIAHSIHRDSRGADRSLFYYTIAQFARETYELVLEIENDIINSCGLASLNDLHYLDELWQRRGRTFWDNTSLAR
jgi:hypothetical protein